MDSREDHGPMVDAGQECDNYRPLAAALDAADSLDHEEAGDLGCDSCLHWREGHCEIYRRTDRS